MSQSAALLKPPVSLYKSCPLCGHQVLKHLWVVKGFNVVRCRNCSLVFVQNILTREELAAHYAGSWDAAYNDGNRECLDYYYKNLRRKIEARVSQPGSILDVGCSGGWFLENMKGWDCHGIEMAEADANLARRNFGDNIFTGTLEDYPSRDNFFDVITMQDVFDHCPQPLPVLAKCHRMLKPGGLLVIKVHNISCLYAKLAGPKFYAILPPFHLFYYDTRTLKIAAEKSGFQVAETKFFAHLLRISTIFARLAQTDKKSPFYRIYRAIENRPLGKLTIKKNLHDIVTVFAVKR